MNTSPASPVNADHAPIIHLCVCGRTWEMERVDDLESLWDSMDVFNEDERLPYWTEIWPSSLVLGEWLAQHAAKIAGKPALDLGCGIGLTALIGSMLGARVIGMDYEPEALAYAQKNAVRNHVPQPCWTVMDWRRPAVQRHALPFIWGGDVMYETRFAAPILNFLDHALSADGTVWIAEPCRSVYDTFRTMAINRKWVCRCVLETSIPAIIPQPRPVPVRIWELTR